MTGLTSVELEAQLADLYAKVPPPSRLLFGSVKDMHIFRDQIGAEERKPPTYGFYGPPLIGIPISIDKELPEGVMELRTGTTVRRFALYGIALTREREATLARFLTTDEGAEDAADDKPRMETGCLRTGHGRCHRCKLDRPIFRYEIDPRHRGFLECSCADDGNICDNCVSGVTPLESGDLIACGAWFSSEEQCTWSEWLDKRALPWLCPACWKTVAADEVSHVQALEAANPF